MKNIITLLGCAAIVTVASAQSGPASIRANQAGYRTGDFKAAVYLGPVSPEGLTFELLSPEAGVGTVDSVRIAPAWGSIPYAAKIYFTSTTTPGRYTLAAKRATDGAVLEVTPVYIGDDAYSRFNLAELPLNYLRQQRCGYNPVHDALCHQKDGFMVLSGDADGDSVDVRGGWHDASDYLQYLTTSANTVYQLLFGYTMQPDGWADEYDASGRPGENGIPDILDEARWGLEWMQRMNPREGVYLNQIADDRDHRFVGMPQNDNTDYGRGSGNGRPVYPVSGTPYGLQKYKNRSTGEASSVAKFASSFALGAKAFRDIDPAFADDLQARALKAYDYAKANPGASQTAPCSSPYFYEEDNWVDDVELAGATMGRLRDAAAYGRLEPVTPWMGADSARHYQWYPFVNLGHYLLASLGDSTVSEEFTALMRQGIEGVARKGQENAFGYGVPFIWCSNNLGVAFLTQAALYRELTGDDSFIEAEAAARDWLFGLNPWGQTMIIMPEGTVTSSPVDPHSAMVDVVVARKPGRDWLVGGIVDGPVYDNIYKALWGVRLRRDDSFAPWHGRAVYHDDFADYSSNEPTMDGTASLAFILGRLVRNR